MSFNVVQENIDLNKKGLFEEQEKEEEHDKQKLQNVGEHGEREGQGEQEEQVGETEQEGQEKQGEQEEQKEQEEKQETNKVKEKHKQKNKKKQKQQKEAQNRKPKEKQKQKNKATEKEKTERQEKQNSESELNLDDEQPKKVKSPLELLPPSKMNLDAVKRNLFFQRPYNLDFFKDFWPGFDSDGYSIYFANYNYNDENSVYFMTCNLLGGFIQRCDDARRYTLASILIAGNSEEAPPFNISGVFVFRGQDVPNELKENPDVEYYTFTKLDSSNLEHRQKVEEWFFADSVSDSSGTLKVLERRFLK